MSDIDHIITELRNAIFVMCNDMDAADSILEKETIRHAILEEEKKLEDLVELRNSNVKNTD